MLPHGMLHSNKQPSNGVTVDSFTAYADDIIIVSRSTASAKEMYSEVKSATKMIGLHKNTNKTMITQCH